jgi:Fis family transcriptional regulator
MTSTSRNNSRRNPSASSIPADAGRTAQPASTGKPALQRQPGSGAGNESKTAIACCVQEELGRYFDMLDGETPSGLYRMVIRQAEHALLSTVMRECGGNQSRAAQWLGISRGNLRNKLADME